LSSPSKRRLFAGVRWFPLGRRVCRWWQGRGWPGDDAQQVEMFGEGHDLDRPDYFAVFKVKHLNEAAARAFGVDVDAGLASLKSHYRNCTFSGFDVCEDFVGVIDKHHLVVSLLICSQYSLQHMLQA